MEGVIPKQIHGQLLKVCKHFLSSIRTVERWVTEFKHDCTNLEGNSREALKSLSTPKINRSKNRRFIKTNLKLIVNNLHL